MLAREEITGVILSGGKSSRMGEEKGFVKFNNKELASYSIDVLNIFCKECILIANKKKYEKFGIPVYNDIIKDSGPLGGLQTALSNINTNWAAGISCDTPFMTSKVYEILIEHSHGKQVVIPEVNGTLHPLVGLYHKSCEAHFADNLRSGNLKVREVIKDLELVIVPLDESYEHIFTNINTKIELEEKE